MSEKPLEGLKVCMVGANRISADTNAYRRAMALANAGAKVTIVNADNCLTPLLEEAPFEIVLTGTGAFPKQIIIKDMNRVLSKILMTAPGRRFRGLEYRLRKARWTKHRQEARWPELEKAAIKTGADVIHTTNLYSIYPAMRAAKKLDAKLIYDSRELWRSVLNDPFFENWFAPDKLDNYIGLEREIAKNADAIITVSEDIAESLAQDYSISLPTVIYSGPLNKVNEVTALDLDVVRVFFQGNYRVTANVSTLIDAMSILGDGYVLTLQGRNFLGGEIERKVQDEGLKNVRIIEQCPFDQTVQEASLHDIGVYPANKFRDGYYDENFEKTVPNKLFTYMAGGLAVVIPDLQAMKRIVNRTGSGVVMDVSTPEGIAEGIRKLGEDREKLLITKNASLAAVDEFLWENQSEKLIEVYKNLR